MDMDELFENADVLSTGDVAEFFGVGAGTLRSWGEENGVPKVGNAFAWTQESVEAAGDDLELFDTDEDEGDEDDSDDDSDEDGEADDDEE